jgi:hypothetical protein
MPEHLRHNHTSRAEFIMDWQSLLLIKRNLGFSLYPMVPKMQTKLQNQGKIIEVPFIEGRQALL